MQNSNIEWTDHTFNPWRGCTKVSPGCANCYAEKLSHRNPKVLGEWGPGKPRIKASSAMWREPVKWNAACEKRGVRERVFCASLADWLDDEVPIEWLSELLELIRMTPALDWLLLTKRPQNWRSRLEKVIEWNTGQTQVCGLLHDWLVDWFDGDAPENVWIGTSVEDQARADERIPLLLDIPAKVRFLSCEPLLGPVDLSVDLMRRVRLADPAIPGIDWVIGGGESGPEARPMHPDWPRSLRDQCVAAGVAFFFKQWGEWGECPIGDGPDLVTDAVFKKGPGHDGMVWKIGKKAAGRLLDGREWNEMPTVNR